MLSGDPAESLPGRFPVRIPYAHTMSFSRERVEEVFTAALELAGDARAELLERACAGEPQLRSKVERLLELDAQDADALAQPALDALDARAHDEAPSCPTRVGLYEILGVLGEGGMGIVYEAMQETPRRPVALKLLQGSLLGEAAQRRFSLESELLGRLEHPNIARVIESGRVDVAGQLRPFIAMERVEGVDLLSFARARKLSTHERIEVLASICDAVHHAHQKGVLHRDLKPSNILVTEDGTPKLVDFGIGRLIEARDEHTLLTRTGMLIGTLDYMSPEQADGDIEGVDTRSDIYALGVIGFELLSGELPIEVRGRSLTEAVRAIREVRPRTLSELAPSLRGDTETILSKALAKEPARRFASAEAFAADWRRLLRDEPILARPATALYRARKFVARNRGLAAGAAVALLALFASSIVSIRWALRADRAAADALVAKERADTEAKTSARVVRYVEDMFRAALPAVANGEELSARQVVDAGRGELVARFPVDSWAGARIRAFVGRIAMTLGDLPEASKLVEAAIPTLERVEGALHPIVLAAKADRAHVQAYATSADAGRKSFEAVLAQAREVGADADDVAMRCHMGLGYLARDREDFAAADKHFTSALAIAERGQAASTQRARLLADLASVRTLTGRFEESERMLARAAEVAGTAAPKLFLARLATQTGNLQFRRKNVKGALVSLARSLELSEKALDADHPSLVQALLNYAGVLGAAKQTAQAEKLLRRALAICEKVEGVSGPAHAQTLQNLGNCHAMRSEVADAMKLWKRALTIQVEVAGPESEAAASLYATMAWGHAQRGEMDTANELKARADKIRAARKPSKR